MIRPAATPILRVMSSPILFMDESGFTGQDFFNPDQPVFVLATIFLPEEECQAIKADHFRAVRARELKHSELCKRPRPQAMVLDFLRRAVKRPEIIKFSILHKRYDLVGQMVDWLVETGTHDAGLNLYERGGHIGLTNVLYWCLPGFGGHEFFVDLLKRFQDMMRLRTRESFDAFFGPLYERYGQGEKLDEVTTYLLGFCVHPQAGFSPAFGFRELQALPSKPFAGHVTCAIALMGKWKPHHTEPVTVISDTSSAMAKERDIWDMLTSATLPPALVGYAGRIFSFPLMVKETRFEPSHEWAGLQLADVLAGAMASRLRWYINGRDPHDSYGTALSEIVWDAFDMHGVWPSDDVTPEETGSVGPDGEDPIEHTVRALRAAGVKPR